ncbi:aldose epimerase family protein [Ramlibacter sp. MAHUQ-53]|uniref:aldose epimerase family protein n=1 Tax=unclassified Ramlibacter TaxID=2617605 RepID=UPI00363DBE47
MTTDSPALLDPSRFEGEVAGRRVGLFLLRSPGGLRAAVSNHGARLLQLVVPGRGGRWHDVVLGYDHLQQMLEGMASMGAVIGRYANRIGHARFTLDGVTTALPANDGPHCLHGGPAGCRFQPFELLAHEADRLALAWTFREADDGFPGEVRLEVTYTLRDPGVLAIDWRATAAGRPTVVNVTAHPFFNLEGQASETIHGQRLVVDAAHYLPVDGKRIPTGEVAPVAGTPFDLRAGRSFSEALAALPDHAFDHCYVAAGAREGVLRRLARAEAPGSGVAMEAWSDAPGLQVFSSSGFDGSLPRHAGKGGRTYRREAAFCLEPQGLPDAPNHPHFPDTSLRPGQSRTGRIEYRFSALG